MPSPFLDVNQASEYLHVSVRWIYDHRTELPHRRFGGQLRFTEAELDKWAAAQRYTTA